MEVLDPGMQAEEFLGSFLPPKALLLPLLTSCSTMGLFNHVITARATDHLLVVDMNQVWELSDRGSIAPQLVGTNRVWDIIFAE